MLVQGGAPGSYIFRTLDFDQGGDHYPDTTLATVTVEGTAVTPATLPTSLIAQDDPVHGDLSSATVDKERTLVFSEDDDPNKFMIDGKQFDPNRVDQEVKLGTVEEWTVRNVTEELHPFHIHVDDFQVISINGEPYQASGLPGHDPPAHQWRGGDPYPLQRLHRQIRLPLPHPQPRGQRHDGHRRSGSLRRSHG